MTSVNLMTPTARRRVVVRASIRKWFTIYCGAIATMAVAWGIAWWDHARAARNRAHFESQYEPINQLKLASTTIEQQIADLQERNGIAFALSRSRPTVSLVGVVSQAVAKTNGGVYLRHLQLHKGDALSNAGASRCAIEIRGLGRDESDIAQLVESIKHQQVFSNVDLKSTIAKRDGDLSLREFLIECAN